MRLLPFLLFAILLACWPAKAASCNFSFSDVNFGSVDTLSGAAVDTSATLSITCANVLSGAVRICPNIEAGLGGSLSGVRQLASAGGAKLNYQLYQDAARTVPWGTADPLGLGTPPTIDLSTTLGGSVSTTVPLYARFFSAQQTAPPATYTSSMGSGQTKITYSEIALFSCLSIGSFLNPSFTVQAVVPANCLISAQAINFGAHGILAANVDAAGGLSVTCTPGTAYAVSLNGGLSNAPPTARLMKNGANAVTYGLYQNSARTTPFGSGTGQTIAGSGTGLPQSVPVYGRVPPQTTPAPGIYSDTVVATVTY